jgi:hypothetical protein
MNGVTLQWRSIKRVECKNCLQLIERGVETRYFKPRTIREVAEGAGFQPIVKEEGDRRFDNATK